MIKTEDVMNIQIPLDDGLLDAVAKKTGQSQEATLAQITELAEQHLKRLLSEEETQPESQVMNMDTFMNAGRKIAQKHEAAFRELAK